VVQARLQGFEYNPSNTLKNNPGSGRGSGCGSRSTGVISVDNGRKNVIFATCSY
jgi:hypothetical protein